MISPVIYSPFDTSHGLNNFSGCSYIETFGYVIGNRCYETDLAFLLGFG